jgi:hypothetical protein
MEQAPNRRLIIRKKLVPKEGEQPPTTVPPVTHGSNCTFNPIADTPKKCPCGGYYTYDSEYTPRECCSGLYTHGVHYKLFDGRYTPDYTPADDKQKCYSGFDKPVIYDFTGDKFIITTKANTPAKETTSGFNIIPASKLRETQREDKRDSRDSRNNSRDWRDDKRDTRDSRDSRNTSRYSREDTRDSRNDRDYHRTRERDYVRNTRVTDAPNSYNGARREPSKFKSDLDSELGKYGRKF